MADSIREQLFVAFGERLETILQTNQYHTDMGKDVLRSHLPPVNSEIVPCIGFHVDVEENTALYSRMENNVLPIRVQGVSEFGSVLPPIMAERVYADILECILADQYTLGYDSGGTAQIGAGDTITGEASGATALVISATLDSGTWAGGNAAGTFTLRRVAGMFQDNEELSVDGVTGMATVDGTQSGQGPDALAGGGLADSISFYTGEVIMPEADGITVGAAVIFHCKYYRVAGNPYSQTS